MKQTTNKETVAAYLATGDQTIFEALYDEMVAKYRRQLDGWAATTSEVTSHEITEIFEDTLIKTIETIEDAGGDFDKLFHRSLYNRYKSELRKLQTQRKHEQYAKVEREDEVAFEIADDIDIEQTVLNPAKKKADQRQLIDFLLSGADATTTAIVEAFLAHPKPTATAIANQLGYHHTKVTRALNRLAAKFNTKQFGDYRDYLVAL